MDAVGHRLIGERLELVNLVLVDVDHVRRGELGGNPFDRYFQLAFGKQREMVELVRVADLSVASFLEVHHAAEQVGYAADVNDWLTHKISTGISPDVSAGAVTSSGSSLTTIDPV